MRKKIIFAVILCSVVFTAVSIAMSEIGRKEKDDLFRQVELFSDALAIIRADYVDEISNKKLIYGALKGMLGSLDPYSQFMDPDTYNELKVTTEGRFGGLGIEITIKDGLLTVITPIEDTPAWRAGIKANDRIVKINSELTRDMTLTDAVKKMRGNPGESVNLSILRESEKKILEFKIVRDIIKIKDVKDARILEGGIGYIRLVEFGESTPRDFKSALGRLNRQGMSALILDLRNNPGGLLDAAVSVTENFVGKGQLIVSTKGRKPSQNLELVSQAKHPILDMPLVVLINEGSASGSEITAGCLKDYGRAVIVGTKSFGKGFVQTVIPLSDGSALRLTTSKYFTPLGKEIHEEGIIPDIVAEEAQSAKPEKAKVPRIEKVEDIFKELEKIPEEKPQDYKSDSQLMRAIDVLKAIKIYKQVK